MAKSPEMEVFLEKAGRLLFGKSRTDAGTNQYCISCGKEATFFKDSKSRAEYRISRLCQNCQDRIFGE